MSTHQGDSWGVEPQSDESGGIGTAKLQESGDTMMEATESSSLVVQTPGSGGGHIVLEEGASVAISSSSETLEELVDQMEIEISDHEGDGNDDDKDVSSESEDDLGKLKGDVVSGVEGGAITIGKVRTVSGGGGEVVSEKIEVSTEISVRRKREGSNVTVDEEKGMVFGRRRRWSSTHEDFPPISRERQLNNDQIVELMELLQVRWCRVAMAMGCWCLFMHVMTTYFMS